MRYSISFKAHLRVLITHQILIDILKMRISRRIQQFARYRPSRWILENKSSISPSTDNIVPAMHIVEAEYSDSINFWKRNRFFAPHY